MEPAEASFSVDIVSELTAEAELVRQRLERYFSSDAGVGFTGRFFEQFVARSDPLEFTSWDVVAVSALSVNVPPRVAAELLLPGETRARVNALLAEIPDESVDLADADDSVIGDDSPLAELYRLVRDLDGMGPTKTSKLLAAKRPRLVPIRDSVVERLLRAKTRWWLPMRTLARNPQLRRLITEASAHVVPDDVSYLRRLDVVLWSKGSESR